VISLSAFNQFAESPLQLARRYQMSSIICFVPELRRTFLRTPLVEIRMEHGAAYFPVNFTCVGLLDMSLGHYEPITRVE